MEPEPTDEQRFPTLTSHGRAMLQFLREHPHAPIYRNQSGNRLTASEVPQVVQFMQHVQEAKIPWNHEQRPPWLNSFVHRCFNDVPYYRSLGSVPDEFTTIAPISRADLSADIAAFVPDSVELERMINFRTSGTSGHPLVLASHPVVAASYLAFHKRALQRFGISLQAARGQVGVVLLGMQQKCFTYVSVTPTMDEAGLAKINLHPNDWHDPVDRAKYLDALQPEVLTGDPISFAELLTLPVQCQPRAMLSTSMALLPGLRKRLEEQFSCPVLDIYSMNEAGPIAVYDPTAEGHVLLQPDMFVEILDDEDLPVPPGQRGEITLTGGFNFCLPLLRYRTGDFASLDFTGPEPVLQNLAGRPPVRYRTASGDWLNNIEITHTFRDLPLPQWSLHQAADGSLTLRHAGSNAMGAEAEAKLRSLFGGNVITVSPLPSDGTKLIQYTSDIADPST